VRYQKDGFYVSIPNNVQMRKLTDTVVLLFLLIGPALVLTCVRQPTEAETVPFSQEESLPNVTTVDQDGVLAWQDSFLP
jgi:hypothetical protein